MIVGIDHPMSLQLHEYKAIMILLVAGSKNISYTSTPQ